MIRPTLLYAGRTNSPAHPWAYFFPSPLAVIMCGVPDNKIEAVEVSYRDDNIYANEPASYYAFMSLEDAEFQFIFPDLRSVKVCSPDFFKSAIARCEGYLVRVKVKPVR